MEIKFFRVWKGVHGERAAHGKECLRKNLRYLGFVILFERGGVVAVDQNFLQYRCARCAGMEKIAEC